MSGKISTIHRKHRETSSVGGGCGTACWRNTCEPSQEGALETFNRSSDGNRPPQDGQWKSSKPTNLKVHGEVSSYQFPIHRKIGSMPVLSNSCRRPLKSAEEEESRTTVYSVFPRGGEQGASHRGSLFFCLLSFLFLLRNHSCNKHNTGYPTWNVCVSEQFYPRENFLCFHFC